MNNLPEVIENEKQSLTVIHPSLISGDLSRMDESRKILREFVRSQMLEGVDHTVIPGTQSQSLLKPGAEKLAKLFGLGSRIVAKDKEIDVHNNFAMFSYTVEIFHLASGKTLAQCEGSCNSQEKKYRFRRGRGGEQEETQIGDVMNTLAKMAQKRAYVGAVISATGASDFYTQDIEDKEDMEQLGIQPKAAPPARVRAPIPQVRTARSRDESTGAPICCSQSMMVSKYDDNTWYCPKCRAKQARGSAAG